MTVRTTRAALTALTNRLLRPLGLEVHGRRFADRALRATYAGGLEHLKRQGFEPATVIDVGVADGTAPLYEAFPQARHVLVEPLEAARPFLEAIARRFAHVECVMAAAGREPGRLTINAHTDIARSSSYWESDYAPGDVTQREVPVVTLDDVRRERNLQPPFLLKIDVQGAELDVLAGAPETLGEAECVVLETSLFEFFQGAPLVGAVIPYLQRRGFVIYDVWALQYRPVDGALSMLDLAFVKADGQFRRIHRFTAAPNP